MKKILLILLVGLFQNFIFGATITSTATGGNWNSGSSWVGGVVPGAADDVVIASGSTITVNTNVSARSITVSGTMSIPADTNVSINSSLIVVTSPSGNIFFNKKSIITLPQNVALYLQNGSNSLNTSDNGVCSNNTEIHVGTTNYAVCTGGGATYTFDQVESAGGINTTIVLSGNQYICTSGTNTTTFTSTVSSGTWSSGNTSVATVNSSTGVITAQGVGTATITYTVAGGGSATRDVYVSSVPAQPGTISGPLTACQGSTGLVYSVSAVANATSYNWFFPDSNWQITSGAGTNSVTVRLNAGAGTGNVYVSASNYCGTSNARYDKWVVVSSPTVAGTVTPANTNVCSPSNSTNLSLSGNTGSILRWESSTDNFAGGTITTINSTGSPITASNVTVDTWYRAVVQNGGCNVQYSNSVKITVYGSVTTPGPISVNGVPYPENGNASYCSSSSVVFSIAPVANATNYTWTIPTGWTLVSGQGTTTATYITGNSSQSENVSVSASNSSICNSPGSRYFYLYLGNAPGAVTINSQSTAGQTRCLGSPFSAITVNASGTGLSYQWYSNNISSNSGGTSLGSSNGAQTSSYTPQSTVIGTLYYYCIVRNCASTSVTSAVSGAFITTSAPSATISYPASPYCKSLTAAQSVTQTGTSGGTYTSSPSGLTINSSTGAITPSTSTAGSYTVTYTYGSGGCTGLTTTATVTINATPTLIITNPAAVCSPSTVDLTAASVTAGSTAGLTYTYWTNLAGTSAYGTPTTATAGTYYIKGTNASGCFVISQVTVTVNPNLPASVSIAASPSGAICSGTSVTFTATPTNPGTTPLYQWKVNGINAGTNSSTYTTSILANNDVVTVEMTSNASPCLTGSPTTSNAVVMTINPAPTTAPLVGTKTDLSCTVSTGSVALSGLPAGNWTITTTPTTVSTPGSGGSTTITGLAAGSYTFTVTNASGCPSPATGTVTISDNSSTTWNGTLWSNGSPDATKNVIISSVPSYTFPAGFTACALTINSGVVATVPSGVTLTVTNAVTTNGQLIFEDKASLVQINDVPNSGAITYKRISQPMKNFDYTYWSSPVAGQTLFNLSPNTLYDKYLSYSGTGWKVETSSNVMKPAIGYIIRTPKGGTWPAPYAETVVFPYSQPVQFIGVPNNGYIQSSQTMVAGNYYLAGNPYPCAIDAEAFLYDNPNNADVLDGTIYFWTHNTPVNPALAQYKYYSADYAAYNQSGGIATWYSPGNNAAPDGYIAAGQSFFTLASKPGRVEFNNSMRVTGNNSTFFKPGKTSKSAKLEKHRLWLNLINSGGAFKQTLIGYIEGATNTYDKNFDGLSFDGNSYIDFYSVNATDNLTIQGRALPFNDADVVPLGYRSTIAGDFTIAIDHADGNLATQRVYLEDKQTGTLTELTAGNYTFNTKAGTFNSRFVLRYANKTTLGTGDFETAKDAISILVQDKTITIDSTVENIDKVFIYDIAGKQLYTKEKVNNLQLAMQNLPFAQQVLLVKIFLENGTVTTKKVVFK